MSNILELFSKKESLDPELMMYYEEGDTFKMIRHPLVYSVPYFENMNAFLNKQLKQKKEAVTKSLVDKDFHHYIWLHERPYRLKAFQDVSLKIFQKSFTEYWSILGEIWTDSENIYSNISAWKNLLDTKVKAKIYFMTDKEIVQFENLPKTLTVYRGSTHDGLSYTLNKDVAKWFAKRFDKKGKIFTRKIKKSEVFAFISRRREEEVIIHPSELKRKPQ